MEKLKSHRLNASFKIMASTDQVVSLRCEISESLYKITINYNEGALDSMVYN